jgi:F0F1-type ATP synthase membrane subunit b/b'
MGGTFLQIFLLTNVFLMGVVATFAVRHALAHFRPHTHDADKHSPTNDKDGHLPPAVRQRLLEQSEEHFQKVLDRSATELQNGLKATAERLNKQLEVLGSEVISSETAQYHAILEELRKKTETVVEEAHTSINSNQGELQTKLAEQMKAEQELLIKQIDTKLADAVVSFLIETMQHEVDLGAQTSYLTKMLEEHKEDFKREVADEIQTPAAK